MSWFKQITAQQLQQPQEQIVPDLPPPTQYGTPHEQTPLQQPNVCIRQPLQQPLPTQCRDFSYRDGDFMVNISCKKVTECLKRQDFATLHSLIASQLHGENGEAGFKGNNTQQQQLYDAAIKQVTGNNDQWSQVVCFKGDESQKQVFKYYASPQVDDALQVVKAVPMLKQLLAAIGQKYRTTVSLKIPGNHMLWAKFNDRLAVDYFDQRAKDEIESAVRSWAAQNQIRLSSRLFDHGSGAASEPGKATGGKEFGSKVADAVASYAMQTMQSGFPAEATAQAVMQHLPQFIENAKS